MSTAFFIPDPAHGGRFHPTEATIGPWSDQAQHGGPPIALLARAIRLHPGEPDMEVSRLTVEFLGPVPLAPCEIEVQVLRPGRRVELLGARYSVAGRPVLTAQAWRLQRVPGICPSVPDPHEVAALPEQECTSFFIEGQSFPYARALEWRLAHGSFATPGPATAWAQARIPLVQGQETGGLEGLLTLLDSANGISSELDFRRWSFVPVDLTLNLYRQPRGPWFGMDARTLVDEGGIGTVHTTVFDSEGPCGKSLHTLFVRPR